MGLKVLFVSSEVSPYAKSGGLGDVAGSLPKALMDAGCDVRVVFPKYRTINNDYLTSCEYITSFDTTLDWRTQKVEIYRLVTDVPTYMIGNDFYFNRSGYYGYGDDDERFTFFSKAAIEFLNYIDFIPDVIHCNDWQTGPLCLYLKDRYSLIKDFSHIKTLFTIHNLQYQGMFTRSALRMMELDDNYYFTNDKLEYYNMVSFMKAGLLYSDAISTVSRTYAYEVQTGQYGYGLDGVLRCRNDVLYGIVNGIDYSANDPATNDKIYCNFSKDDISGKYENKRRLQQDLGLPQRDDVPVLGVISRLVDQKGINLILQDAYELINRGVQLVILGTGDYHYENMFKDLAYRYPENVSANILFDNTLAQRIYAGSDMFLMPSLFEPCGLGQLFAMSYGTVPITRTTGGLVDTVHTFDPETGEGNGFQFQDYDGGGLLWAVDEALKVYNDKPQWAKVVQNAITTRFSWEKSAKEYIDVYQRLVEGRQRRNFETGEDITEE
ncbi:MAG: glycogen synthase GlgA [Firmicutes bacterium]|nr:glycogen synthase GlgA [Bacillota bacterium]